MFYTVVIIVVPCFVSCAFGGVPADGLLSGGNCKDVGEAVEHFGSSHKAVNRPRRSIWTRFIDDVASVFGTAGVKPLVAGGVEPFENIMLSRPPFNVGEESHVVEKKLSPREEEAKLIPTIVIHPKIRLLYTLLHNYIRTYQYCVMRESVLINRIVKNKEIKGKIDFSDLFIDGLNNIKAERLLSIVFATNLKFKNKTLNRLFKLRRRRAFLHKALQNFNTIINNTKKHIPPEDHQNYIDDIQKRLKEIIELNDKWLKFDSKFQSKNI